MVLFGLDLAGFYLVWIFLGFIWFGYPWVMRCYQDQAQRDMADVLEFETQLANISQPKVSIVLKSVKIPIKVLLTGCEPYMYSH